MDIFRTSNFLFGDFWKGWRRWAAWSVCIGAVLFLGALRTATDAELAFASLTLFPVLFIAWIGGKGNGLLMAFLGAVMWAVGDIGFVINPDIRFPLPNLLEAANQLQIGSISRSIS